MLESPGPISIQDLAVAVGRHHNTVRDQLGALIDRGLVTRERALSGLRGRPAWLYRTTKAATRTDSELGGLVTALATQLEQVSPDPRAAAVAAGERWGAGLADPGDDVRRTVLTVLDELGFDPETDADSSTVRLRACPLVDASAHEPSAVCDVHRGIIRGIIRSAGGDPECVDLIAFHEPKVCLVTWDGPHPEAG
jgi:predicted ArsR family transcriptional regulator